MQDTAFMGGANQIFDGQLRINRSEGEKNIVHKAPIAVEDLAKIDEYFSKWATNNTILQHKVFFDLMFGFTHRGCEGIRKLHKDSFTFGTLPDSREYLQE